MSKKRKGPTPPRSGGNGSGNASPERRPARAIKAKAPRKKGKPVPTGPGVTILPPAFSSIGRGFKTIVSDPVLALLPLIVVAAVWVGLLAGGLRYLPPAMVNVLSIPPVGSYFDIGVAGAFFGLGMTGLLWIMVFTVIRAAVTAVLVGMIEESNTFGRVSMVGPLRGLQAFGAVLIFEYFAIVVAMLSTILAQSFGQSIGLLLNIIVPVAAMFLLCMAPFVAVTERVSGPESVRRAARAARLPGWPRFLTIIVFYYFLMAMVVPIFQPGRDQVTAAPSFETWIWVFATAVVNLGFFATIGNYWRAAEPYIGAQTSRKSEPLPRRN